MKPILKKSKLMIASVLLMTFSVFGNIANAATVSVGFSPVLDVIFPGDSFMVDIIGTYNADGTEGILGGALDLTFNSDILNVTSVSLWPTTNPAPTDFGSSTGTIDNIGGSVLGIEFATFSSPVTGSFTYATVEFDAVGVGVSDLGLADSNDLIFRWANENAEAVPVIATSGSVTVVPLPAAVWFFLSGVVGILGIGGVRRQ